MGSNRHWPIINWHGEVVAAACKVRSSVTPDQLPMAETPDAVTCRKCRNSERLQAFLREQEQQEDERRGAREIRAVAALIERHRAEYEALLEAEEIVDALGRSH
jgi:hypothetical protein